MASTTENADKSTAETTTPAQNIPARAQEEIPSSTPVEMNSLKNDNALRREATHESRNSAEMPLGPTRVDTSTALLQSQNPPTAPVSAPVPTTIERTVSTAIGPSSDQPVLVSKTNEVIGPTLLLTLLLTNGARHPFKLDSKYLAKRNVTAQGDDPFNLSVYKLKELILREWRDEWEAKPSSPSSIRLISFGKLLDDKQSLKDLKFNADSANVLHMTIKPQDFIEDEDSKGAKASHSHSRDGTERRSPGCRCIIM